MARLQRLRIDPEKDMNQLMAKIDQFLDKIEKKGQEIHVLKSEVPQLKNDVAELCKNGKASKIISKVNQCLDSAIQTQFASMASQG